jgi:hypothetical protein
MHLADIANGAFELGTGIWVIRACACLHRDKVVKGTSYGLQFWVTSWGYYNLYFYPSLDQWFSFTGGLLVVAFNTIWLLMAFHYHRNPGGKHG